MIKLPPKSKIYEAYSCIADNRIKMQENTATVTSSDRKKTYEIKWKDEDYSSTDNASFWQGYPGYPIIATLMLQNKLHFNKEVANLFANINWHELNDKYKRNYDAAVLEVLSHIEYDQDIIKNETNKIYEELKNLTINIKRKI